MTEPSTTIGVDLAAGSPHTALSVLRWGPKGAVLSHLAVGVTDEDIVDSAAGSSKIGIDCPLGWPDSFVAFLQAHSSLAVSDAPVDGGMDWRRSLAFRATDQRIRERIGRWPLSVATDRLGLTALRCAGLLGRLAEAGHDVDRTGERQIVEVYPGGSLRLWGLHAPGYRTSADIRARVLADLIEQAPWLMIGQYADALVQSADALDSLIASLSARAAQIGAVESVPPALREQAEREGWAALPTGQVRDLLVPQRRDL